MLAWLLAISSPCCHVMNSLSNEPGRMKPGQREPGPMKPEPGNCNHGNKPAPKKGTASKPKSHKQSTPELHDLGSPSCSCIRGRSRNRSQPWLRCYLPESESESESGPAVRSRIRAQNSNRHGPFPMYPCWKKAFLVIPTPTLTRAVTDLSCWRLLVLRGINLCNSLCHGFLHFLRAFITLAPADRVLKLIPGVFSVRLMYPGIPEESVSFSEICSQVYTLFLSSFGIFRARKAITKGYAVVGVFSVELAIVAAV